MKLPSGGNIAQACKNLRSGDILELEANGRYKPTYLFGHHSIKIHGNGSSIIGKGVATCLKFEECENILLTGINLYRARSFGLMVVESKGFTGRNIIANNNGATGILTGNASDIFFYDIEASLNVREHGIYFSQSGDNLHVEGARCNGNGRSGIQCNAVQEGIERHSDKDGITNELSLINCHLEGNQIKGGAAALTLAGVHGALIQGLEIREHYGRHGIAMWDDDTDEPDLACWDITIEKTIFEWNRRARAKLASRACISVSEHCKRIKVSDSNQVPHQTREVDGDGANAVSWF